MESPPTHAEESQEALSLSNHGDKTQLAPFASPNLIPGAKPGRRRRASAVTRVFGHFMDTSKLPQATWVVGVLTLSKDPGGNSLRDLLWERVMRVPRFRSKLVVGKMGGHWTELAEEELVSLRDSGYLWSEVLLDGTAERTDVDRVVNECGTWKYDRYAPLWRVQYCRKALDGRAHLIFTVNHAIGDGVSLIATVLGLSDNPPDLSKTPHQMAKESKAALPAKPKAKKGPKLGVVTKVKAFTYGVYEGLTSSVWSPDKKNALTLPDVLHPSSTKKMAHALPIDLNEMKQVKNKFPGATLNDVMMAVLTAAIRAYLLEVNDPAATNGQLVRANFPINMRSKHDTVLRNGDPHNKWTYGLFTFDFKYKTRIELVWKVKRQVDKIKLSPSPAMMFGMAGVLTKTLPRDVLLNTMRSVANIGCSQISNVPGPSQPIYFAGAKVDEFCFNLFSPVGLYVGIVSYDGKVNATVNVDDSVVQCDPEALVRHWNAEFLALKQEVEAFGDGVLPQPRHWF